MTSHTEDTNGDSFATVVVVRHGERVDYASRDGLLPDGSVGEKTNWVAAHSDRRPFDPPLTEHGKQQAERCGRHLTSALQKLGLPSTISAIYSSPLLRCRQTSLGIQAGLLAVAGTTKNSNDNGMVASIPPVVPVRVELGLAESINEDWYRSWALPGSDGTWGFGGKDAIDPATIHPLAKQPIQSLLDEYKTDMTQELDLSYDSPLTSVVLTKPYSLEPPLLETQDEQRGRMGMVANTLCAAGQTIVLVSHGGPVHHLYEELIHDGSLYPGETTYCAYSIYKCRKGVANGDTKPLWEAVQVNISQATYDDGL